VPTLCTKISATLLAALTLAFIGSLPLSAQQAAQPAPVNDSLPRHAVIGMRVGPPNTAAPEDPSSNPPTVQQVFPGTAAEGAGFQAGDILRTLDGKPVTTAADFAHEIARHLGTDTVQIEIVRNGQPLNKSVTLKPRPYETSPDAEILYRSVGVEGARRRTIVTIPKATDASAKRHPALLLMGGLGCYSLDGEFTKPGGYGPILAALNKNNYVTMRVEKTGQGDSEGPACTDDKATAELEAAGYVAALAALKSYDFVDPSRIFVFAHSLGPLIAALALPRSGAKDPVQVHGFIAAETIGRSWFEYMVENNRRQSALVGQPLDEVDSGVRTQINCLYHFHVLYESADAVSKISSQCASLIRSYAGVPGPYMQQIGDISLGRQWKQLDIPVLVIYGTSDPVTSADESRYLVNLINSFHPGRASYAEISGMSHDFARYGSPAAYMTRNPAESQPYDDEIVSAILTWLAQHS